MPRTLLPLLVLLLPASLALAQPRPVLTISFDQDFNGAGVNGVVAGAPEGKPELAPGKVGLGFPSLAHAQVVEAEIGRGLRLGVPGEQWPCLDHIRPLGEAFSPPQIVLGDRRRNLAS